MLVRRYDGPLNEAVSVQYRTKDGTAVAGLDFEGASVRLEGVLSCSCGPLVRSRALLLLWLAG